MRLISIVVVILILIGCKDSSKIEKSEISNSSTEKREITSPLQFKDEIGLWDIGFILPKKMSTSPQPLIVYLHGGIGTSRTDKGDYADTMYSFIQDSFPVILASPSGNRNAPWWSQAGLARIFGTVQVMKQLFNIDSSRIFLAGVSDGATALFAVASQENHPFAGFIGASAYPLMYNNQLDFDLLKTTPFFMYISGKDRLYPTEPVINYYDLMKSKGIHIDYKLYENEEHGFDYKLNEREFIISLLSKWSK
jgi:predicted peptidase